MKAISNILSCAILFVAIVSCDSTKGIEEQRADLAIVNVLAKSGEPIDNISIQQFDAQGETKELTGLDVVIATEMDSYSLIEVADGHYRVANDEVVFQDGVEYHLRFSFADEEVTSQTTIPPALDRLSSTSQVFDSSKESEFIFLDWNELNIGSFAEYFYIVSASPLDKSGELERIDKDCVNCHKNSGQVLLSPDAVLSIDDFDFLGQHLIEVFAISIEDRYLFEDQTDYTQNGVSNVKNGFGLFVGVSVLSTTIEVL